MAKIYKGTVSIVKNTKGQITVQADSEGQFSQQNAQELYTTMCKLAKKHKADMKYFKPEALGDTAILLADRWGKPYVAVLPAAKVAGEVKQISKVEKLA